MDIAPAMVEAYRVKRIEEPSGRSPQNLTKPATVNREIACLKTIFNKAINDGKAERNPVKKGLKPFKENNEGDRVLLWGIYLPTGPLPGASQTYNQGGLLYRNETGGNP